jgi:hypothetical protein
MRLWRAGRTFRVELRRADTDVIYETKLSGHCKPSRFDALPAWTTRFLQRDSYGLARTS